MTSLRLLGPFPPPYGGVAIHLVRLTEALRERGVAVHGVSLGGVPDRFNDVRSFGPRDLLRRSPVHYHTDEGNARWMMLFGSVWQRLKVPYVVTVHSFRDRPEFASASWTRRLYRAFEGARAVIAISEEVRADLVQRLGLDPMSITVIGSDLPISSWEQTAPLPASLPDAWRSAPVRIVANATRLAAYDGEDLYGMDLLAEAGKGLGDDVALALVIGEVVHPELLDRLVAAAAQHPRLFVIRDLGGPLLPVVAQANVVVRPTRTEGGRSLTLAEALELGRWAIGSDAVPRPHGTRTFPSGDAQALHAVLVDVCDQVRAGIMPQPLAGDASLVTELLEIYRRSFSLSVSR